MEWQNINKDDTILIQSDTTWTMKRTKCTIIEILESFIEAAGTVVFPTFNTDFGDLKTPFDIRTTPSKMGMLTEYARKYKGAVRSGHPMFSFVAIGKNAHLFNVNNFSGYGKDSPFAILHKLHAKIGVLGLPDSRGNTFHHHVEEMNRVPYRVYKNFTGDYIDRHGTTEKRTYAFYCRNLANTTILDPIGELMWEAGLWKGDRWNEGTGFRVIEMDRMYEFVTEIIKSGRAENLLYKKGEAMTENDVMKILEEELSTKLDMNAEAQWDSLDQVVILQKFDEVFDNKIDGIPEQELAIMTTPRKIIDALKKHKLIE